MFLNFRLSIILLVATISFNSCVTTSHYLSPLYGTASNYHTMPLKQDSVKYSLYANGSFNVGGNNEDLRDNSYSFQGNLYNLHQFGLFKGWYGAGLTLGNYEISRYDTNTVNPDFDTAFVNKYGGNNFFGSANLAGGIGIAIPISRSGEWRIIAVSATLQNEFGKYLQFRQRIEKDHINVSSLAPNSLLATIGISTGMAWHTRNGSIALQTQLNYLLGKSYTFTDYDNNGEQFLRHYNYVNNTVSYTRNRLTGFLQANIGKRMSNFGTGVNYRLIPSKKKTTVSRTT